MEGSAVFLQPAYILQHRPYRESSVLLDAFTRDFGIISVLAKGVRKEKSKLAGVLQPFSLLKLSYLDKNELKILTHAEYLTSYSLEKLGLYCGFYVNELVQKFLHKYDPHPQLFFCYQTCLQALLDSKNIEQCLRYFELDLLEEVGYGVQLDIEQARNKAVASQRRYKYIVNVGMVEDKEGDIGGNTLLALSTKAQLSEEILIEAKHLLRQMLNIHLQGKPLKSREVLAKIIKYL